VSTLGTKADPERDHIKVKGKLINQRAAAPKKYLLVNKPRGYLSSVSDPKQRPLVGALVPVSSRRGLHPVGRLDFNTEGLIILTNDGDLTKLLTQAGVVTKVYHAKVKGSPSEEQLERLRKGIRIGETKTAPAEIRLLERTREAGNTWFEVTLRQGKNQQIRRMFDSIGHSVIKLRRVSIGHLGEKGLATGECRELKTSEIQKFYNAPSPQSARGPKAQLRSRGTKKPRRPRRA
jgi:23S rRNA pseudouridine2605 synthase